MKNVQSLKLVLEILSLSAVVLGVPAGLGQYYLSVRKEQQDREYGTYDALDNKFHEYQRLCFDNPDLDIHDVPLASAGPASAERQRREDIAFTILFAIFERAYLMYADQSTELKEKQWAGWDEYIRSFCQRENFRRAWRVSGSTFDADFEQYMRQCIPPEG